MTYPGDPMVPEHNEGSMGMNKKHLCWFYFDLLIYQIIVDREGASYKYCSACQTMNNVPQTEGQRVL